MAWLTDDVNGLSPVRWNYIRSYIEQNTFIVLGEPKSMNVDGIHAGRFVYRWHFRATAIADSDAKRFDRRHADIAAGSF